MKTVIRYMNQFELLTYQHFQYKSRWAVTLKMIGVNPTKVQLTNEDLSEYEAKKQTWKRLQPLSKELDSKSNGNSQKQQSADTYRRKEVQTRIGVKKWTTVFYFLTILFL